jgi:inner membrane protein
VLISHLALDCFTHDQAPPYGLQVFWPFSDRYVLSPFTPFLDVNKGADNGTFLLRLFSLHNVKTVFVEILILGPVALWAGLRNRGKFGVDRG